MPFEESGPDTERFGYGAEEALLRQQARKFLDEHAGLATLRRLVGDHEAVYERGELPAYDAEAWRKCVELGWPLLAVPESCGGLGARMVAVAALVEEVGRHAFPSPLIATLMSSLVLRQAHSPEANRWLGRIAEGTTLALAIGDRSGGWDLDASEVRAARRGAEVVLDGTAYAVQDAFKVDGFLVAAHTDEGLCLVVVERGARGLEVVRDHIFDLTRDQGHLTLSGVRVAKDAVVVAPRSGLHVLERAWPGVLTVVSADLVGASEWQLQTTVEYAKVRKQFDRTIGFFQAVKHPLVDAMIEIDLARSHLYDAACCIDVDPAHAEQPARMAKAAASDAARVMSKHSVQLHGGIGFTWECDVHLFFKRNQHNAALYGDGVHQRRKLAAAILGPAGN